MVLIMKYELGSLTKAAAFFSVFVFCRHFTVTPVLDFSQVQGWRWTKKYLRGEFSPAESITCDRSHYSYDLCSINGPALLDPTTSTLFSIGNTNSTPSPKSFLIKTKPYPRKTDERALSRVRELALTSAPPNISCGITHTSPALVFSTGGCTGNFFHEFMDCFVPLYITVNSHFPDRNVILVITDYHDWWTSKYAELLPRFTRHPIINIDKENISHCFPLAIVGLISHGRMVINPALLPKPKTLMDFQAFLANTYRGDDHHQLITKPKLALINRNANVGRMILNAEAVKKTAREVGFDVTIFKPKRNTSLAESFRLIHASHAMLGVHGAALTHFLFLRPGSVLMQVVPIGTEWLSDAYFGKPTTIFGLEYMKYKIKLEESSLAEVYRADDLVLKNPKAFIGGNWSNAQIYLKKQNVKLDIVRFRRYLRDAYKKAKDFMDKAS